MDPRPVIGPLSFLVVSRLRFVGAALGGRRDVNIQIVHLIITISAEFVYFW